MELTFHGANCIKMVTKNATMVVDDNLSILGGKQVAKSGDIVVQTHSYDSPVADSKICIDQPGEYEVSDISIIGVAARAHMDEPDKKTATIYKFIAHDISVVVLGHVFEEITEDELEELGHVDVLIIPVGNKGYTLDGKGAKKVIKSIEPKLVIPTHYADKDLKFEVDQDNLEDALKLVELEPTETVSKLKLKAADIPDILRLVVLEKQ